MVVHYINLVDKQDLPMAMKMVNSQRRFYVGGISHMGERKMKKEKGREREERGEKEREAGFAMQITETGEKRKDKSVFNMRTLRC